MNIIDVIKKIEEARNIAFDSPELNMGNYNFEDVDKLNDAMIEVYEILDELNETLSTEN